MMKTTGRIYSAKSNMQELVKGERKDIPRPPITYQIDFRKAESRIVLFYNGKAGRRSER